MQPLREQPREQPPRDHVVPMGAARATLAAMDAMAAPLTRAIEQGERELGIVREHEASERRVLAEADQADEHPDALSSVAIFDAKASIGLIAEIDAALREDGCATDIGVRRNATGYVTAIVVSYHRPEGGR